MGVPNPLLAMQFDDAIIWICRQIDYLLDLKDKDFKHKYSLVRLFADGDSPRRLRGGQVPRGRGVNVRKGKRKQVP